MEVLNYLSRDSFVLFLAPPAWGKTTLVKNLYSQTMKSILFISPLRALAEEVYLRMKSEKSVFLSREYFKSKRGRVPRQFFMISTVESLPEEFIEQLDVENTIVIIDEFHLFYQWGETFRYKLKEFQLLCGSLGLATMGMSASFTSEHCRLWHSEYFLNYQQLYVWNEGNLQFKNRPEKIYYYPIMGRKLIHLQFKRELIRARKNKKTILLFCEYRHEIDYWCDFCARLKFRALGCVGGGVPQFLQQLKENSRPDCIISTTVLSHGVNLPVIEKVFINYPLKDFSFWLQMCSRAGRNGERFYVYTLNHYGADVRQRIFSYLSNIIELVRYFLITNIGVLYGHN